MKLYFKRSFDLIFSFLLLIFLLPLFFIVSLLIKIDSKGPVLFKQKRVGKKMNLFYIYKFRTMKLETPKNIPTDKMLNPNNWVTRIGNFLRKTSIDELPQLINVIKGEMSIVGPRPALWNQKELIQLREEIGVNELRPGITGLAQINGRDLLDLSQKVKLDFKYLKDLSILNDIKIIIKTIFYVINKRGFNEKNN